MMKKILLFATLLTVFYSCYKNPITGRNQFSLVPESELQQVAGQQYQQQLSSGKVENPSSSKDAAMVRRVGQRISAAITEYYKEQGKPEVLEGYQWEFNLINDKQVNAWCLPGGKVAVYTGLLPVTQNEAALAVVMGHEIAHALARHGNERVSQGLAAQFGQVALSVAMANKPAETQNMVMAAYGAGATVGVLLPFSRKQELEADHYGLLFAAMAGYNPREAVPFWQRMSQAGGQKPPEFLSTHPADETRIKKLEGYMEEALKFYKPVENLTPTKR